MVYIAIFKMGAWGYGMYFDMQKIGHRIKFRRTQLGLSQADLAQKVGYSSKVAISNIETGRFGCPHYMIEKIAEVLMVTPLWLEFGSDDPPPLEQKLSPVPGSDDYAHSHDKAMEEQKQLLIGDIEKEIISLLSSLTLYQKIEVLQIVKSTVDKMSKN